METSSFEYNSWKVKKRSPTTRLFVKVGILEERTGLLMSWIGVLWIEFTRFQNCRRTLSSYVETIFRGKHNLIEIESMQIDRRKVYSCSKKNPSFLGTGSIQGYPGNIFQQNWKSLRSASNAIFVKWIYFYKMRFLLVQPRSFWDIFPTRFG